MSYHTCEHIEDLLPAYVDHALSADDARAVRAHLADCAACRVEAERWARLDGLLDEHLPVAQPVPSPDVEGLIQRLHRERPVWRVAPAPVRFWRTWMPAAGVAAAAVLLALAGLYAPGVNLDDAKEALLDEAMAVAADSRQLPQVAPEQAMALYEDARSLPKHAALGASRQWDASLSLAQALTRRVGFAPLATCVLLLFAANVMVARGVRGRPRSLQGG